MKILLIEDEDNIRELLAHYMRGDCFFTELKILKAEKLDQGMKMLQEEKPDIVILDLSLPDSTAERSVSKIPEISKVCPVIVLTGTEEPEVIRKSIENGAADYLLKSEDIPGIKHAVFREVENRKKQKRLELRSVGEKLDEVSKELKKMIGE